MSIISDALKKAERERELKAKQAQEGVPGSEAEQGKLVDSLSSQAELVEEEIKRKADSELEAMRPLLGPRRVWLRRFLELMILLGVVSLVVAVLFVLPFWPGPRKNSSPDANLLSRANRPFGGAEAPGRDEKRSGRNIHLPIGRGVSFPFVLSGISVQGKDRYAVVNDAIVQEGDFVNGVRVKSITAEEVTLAAANEDLTLRIPA